MLTLYARTEKAIANIDKDIECQSFMPNNSAGAIIWNYLQREIWRYRNPEVNLVKCVIATEFVAPYVAWKMQKDNNQFSISKRAFRESVGEACHRAASLTKEEFRNHISDILCETNCPLPNEEDIRNFLKTDLRLFVDKGTSYSLMHQQFRDALVALHLINSSYYSVGLPDEWKSPVDFYVMQFVSQLASQEEADCLWEQNREMDNHWDPATINVLELQNRMRKSDFSRLSFKGLNLSNISMYRYRHPGTRTLLLPVCPSQNEGLIVSEKTFYPASHLDAITALAITEDGKKCISASKDYTLRVWDLGSGQCQMLLEGHSCPIYTLAISRDGKRCVSGADDSSICIWDLEFGKCLYGPIKAHSRPVNSLVITQDGKRCVSGSWDKTLRIIDLQTGECMPTPLVGHAGPVWKVAVSADGKRCASGSEDGTIRIWDMENGSPIGKPLEGHEGRVNTIAFFANGSRIVSGSSDNTLRIWDVETGESMGRPLTGHEGPIWDVAITPDGERCVSRSEDRTLRVWNILTGTRLKGFAAHELPIMSFSISPDGKRCVSGSNNTLHIWDLKTRRRVGKPLTGHEGTVTAIAITPDGKRCASGSGNGTIRIWDLNSGQTLGEPQKAFDGKIDAIAAGRNTIVFRSHDATVRVWDLESGHCRHVIEEKQQTLIPIAVSADDKKCYLQERDERLLRMDVSYTLALPEVTKTVVHILDLKTGTISDTFMINETRFIKTITPDGQRCIGGAHGKIPCIWNLKTGETLDSQIKSGYVKDISPDGKYSVGFINQKDGLGYRMVIWDTKTGEVLKVCPRASFSYNAIFSPNGKWIVFSGSKDLVFWSFEDDIVREMVGRHFGQHVTIEKLAVCNDGNKCVTLSSAGELHVWNPEKNEVKLLPGVEDRIRSIAITQDGKRCVAGSYEGVLYEWILSTGEMHSAKVLPLFLPGINFSQGLLSSTSPKLGETLRQNGAIV